MYALHQFLKQNYIEAEILNYQPAWNNTKPQIKSIRQLLLEILFRVRAGKFKRDSRKYLRMTSVCRSVKELTERKQPDVYIAGRDQIWNPRITHGYDDIYYLNFPTTAHKMFYAASIGLDNIDSDTMQQMIEKIDTRVILSVREQQLCDALRSNTELQVTHVLDPVLLLDAQIYQSMMSPCKNKDFLLIYLMGNNDKCYQLANRIAREKKLQVIQSGKLKKRDGVDKAYATLSPTEFLGLMHGTDYVVTNPFHGIAYSILFRKQFTTVKIDAVQSRITSLLNTMQLSYRCIDDAENFQLEEINYDKYELIITSAVQSSRQFLLDSLEGLRRE